MSEKEPKSIDEADQQPETLSHVSNNRRFRLVSRDRFKLIGTEYTNYRAKISFIGKVTKVIPQNNQE